jgi:hypothetical protein
MATETSRSEKAEGFTQIMIMFAIGIMAAAASFTHVHDVAVAHGQPDWIGWADAVVVELMSIALGLELRRRARTGRPVTFIMITLVFFIAVSLSAQVVEAERSIIGWLAAALPALGFLVLAKVVLSRTVAKSTNTEHQPETATQPATTAEPATPAPVEPKPGPKPELEPVPLPVAPVQPKPAPPEIHNTPVWVDSTPVPTHLLPTARFALVNHEQTTGQEITADELAARMSIRSEVARQLLEHLNPRINGTALTGGAK